ncbi:MAG: lamin tail domain-containing protein [Saprospiraceae bacterium]
MNLRNVGLLIASIGISTAPNLFGQACSGLYISEYIEGGSFNKCIEIYNPTGSTIDLGANNYSLNTFSNGATTPTYTVNLMGMLAPGEVFVVCHTSADATFLALANQVSPSVNYNGDDAVVLLKGTDTLDIIGVIGVDPDSAWTGGSASTANQTLVRRRTVQSGVMANPASFDPSVEWVNYAQDFIDSLGSHVQAPCRVPCSDLYISEYIEGSSFNKCIEIYNPTGSTVDLGANSYSLNTFSNGATTATYTVNLAGMLAPGEVFVVCHTSATSPFLTLSDQTSTGINYNGDDAVVLLKGTDTLDIIGVIGVDPGSAWTGGSTSTANQTLVRRPAIQSGILSNPVSFDPSVEWIMYAQDFIDSLGTHVQEACSSPSTCTELFISEYVEGNSNNKCIEIYNPTSGTIDLAAGMYSIAVYFNGSTSAGLTVNLTGMVAAGDVFVLCQSSADPTLLGQSDQTSGSGFYNGDDAVALLKNGVNIDVIGQIGFDPGSQWGGGDTSTQDNTLVRKPTIGQGDPDGSDAFYPSLEWIGYPNNTFSNIGSHTETVCSSALCDSLALITQGIDPCSGPLDGLTYGLFWYVQTTQSVSVASSTHGAMTMQIAPDTILVSMMNIPSGDPAEVVLVGDLCNDTLRLQDTISCDICTFILPPDTTDQTFCGNPLPSVFPDGGGFPQLRNTTDLFFSEYIEGSGFNKCLEIFNGTGLAVDLAAGNYTIEIYFNGNTSATSQVDLSGILPDQSTFVVCDNGADMAFLALTDQIDNNLSFTGDDAITLSKNGVIIDVIGQLGFDPGGQWGSGLTSTQDNTLVRKPTVYQGDMNPGDPFDPATEWNGFAQNTMSDLGMHTYTAMDTMPDYYNFYDDDPSLGGTLIATGVSLVVASGVQDSTIYVTAVSMGCESEATPLSFRSLPVESPSCQDLVHISLTTGCDRVITPADVLSGSYNCTDAFQLLLTDHLGHAISGNRIDINDVGSLFTYRVRNQFDGATCWGEVRIEKKFPPVINCADVTISCTDSLPVAPVPLSCDPYISTTIQNQTFTHLNCSSRFVGYYDRTILVSDLWGNQQSCDQRIWVERATLDDLRFPEDEEIDCLNPGLHSFVTSTLDDQGYYHPIPYIIQGINIGVVDAPSIDGEYLDPNLDHCNIVSLYEDMVLPSCGKSYTIRRNWIVKDWCTGEEITDIQYIRIIDSFPPRFEKFPEPVVEYNVHDCKAGATFYWPEVNEECTPIFDLTWHYESTYSDPGHPGKEIALYGEVTYPDPIHIYLPFGAHLIKFNLRDACENDTTFNYLLIVKDELPPEPVCDEITQISLDPQECWARIYAKDLDDGSHDACCDRLHFAVANMDSVTYWRNYWTDYISRCLDPYDYHHNYDDIQEAIDEWIDVFVFDDYIDVTECGEENLVLRVYEACGLPDYDEHLFAGGEHEWYWWHLSERFARWHWWQLDAYLHYGDPRPVFDCSALDFDWNIPVVAVPSLGNYDSPYGYENKISRMEFTTDQARMDWEARVGNVYPAEVQTINSLLQRNRWYFYHLANDCMIQVLKDDKVPPVVKAPEDITVYCDGVPY